MQSVPHSISDATEFPLQGTVVTVVTERFIDMVLTRERCSCEVKATADEKIDTSED